MRIGNKKGFTLVELLLVITIMGIIVGATMPLLSTSLKAHATASAHSSLSHEGLLIMDRITSGLRKTTVVAVPNGHLHSRDLLAFSRLVNSDNDFYFADPLFPRIDEDPGDYYSFGSYGIAGIDEDGDGLFDEGDWRDEDEDGLFDEDSLNGLDDDGDGTIDEGVRADYNADMKNGILGIDDDGDGTVDESQGANHDDDDEDGAKDEEEILFVVYTYNSSTNSLTEIHSTTNGIGGSAPQVVLSTRVTNFIAEYITPTLTKITLELTGDDDKVVQFVESVYVRNVLQKTGKRVR